MISRKENTKFARIIEKTQKPGRRAYLVCKCDNNVCRDTFHLFYLCKSLCGST